MGVFVFHLSVVMFVLIWVLSKLILINKYFLRTSFPFQKLSNQSLLRKSCVPTTVTLHIPYWLPNIPTPLLYIPDKNVSTEHVLPITSMFVPCVSAQSHLSNNIQSIYVDTTTYYTSSPINITSFPYLPLTLSMPLHVPAYFVMPSRIPLKVLHILI